MVSYDDIKWDSFTTKLNAENIVEVTCLKELISYSEELKTHGKTGMLLQIYFQDRTDMKQWSTDDQFASTLFVEAGIEKQF